MSAVVAGLGLPAGGCTPAVAAVAGPTLAASLPPLPPRGAAGKAATVYVDGTNGADTNAGTVAAPFMTLRKAQAAVRGGGGGSTVFIRAGTYHLADTLQVVLG